MTGKSTDATTSVAARPYDRLRGRILFGLVLAAGLLGGVGSWAVTARLSGAVIATGTVRVDQNLKEVQHRDGGIVAAILVREGDEVQAGQVLFRLDDAQSRAELSILQAQLVEAEARRARLIAERDGLPEVVFPDHLLTREAALADILNGERRLHAGHMANYTNQRQQLELGVAQIGEEIAALQAQKMALIEELSLVEASQARIRDLDQKRLIEAAKVEDVAREITKLRGRLGELDANIARSNSRISEVRMRILSVEEVGQTEAQKELVLVESRIQELSDRIMAVSDRLGRTEIRAPIAGRINELTVFTVGGVITPAEVLATIVPEGAELRIEVQLPTTAIDQIYLGQPARVRFSAFNHRTTPELPATVSYVSPATAKAAPDQPPFYTGHVELLDGEMDSLDGMELMPGMPVEVYLTTQEQTALSYFVRPLVDQYERALREE
ncbi:MAG: HlyD family type I secretion periplasmic adaptor subunit [Tabrizicola flagellatus]|uniref:HlyD family type I secretion periplasmic adaptor subunit n=1 Tax=Tabrizicola flagellatus TaxID=2593021 RepID=UPI003918CD83